MTESIRNFQNQARSIFGKTQRSQTRRNSSEVLTSVGFVCTANICRSAYAHHTLQNSVQKNGTDLTVTSAGVYGLVGQPMDVPLQMLFKEKYGYFPNHSAQQVTEEFLAQNQLILVMAQEHRTFILKKFPKYFSRVFLLSEFLLIINQLPEEKIASARSLSRLSEMIHRDRYLGGEAADLEDPYRMPPEVYERVASTLDQQVGELAGILHRFANETTTA